MIIRDPSYDGFRTSTENEADIGGDADNIQSVEEERVGEGNGCNGALDLAIFVLPLVASEEMIIAGSGSKHGAPYFHMTRGDEERRDVTDVAVDHGAADAGMTEVAYCLLPEQ